jgi:hypothetical protein
MLTSGIFPRTIGDFVVKTLGVAATATTIIDQATVDPGAIILANVPAPTLTINPMMQTAVKACNNRHAVMSFKITPQALYTSGYNLQLTLAGAGYEATPKQYQAQISVAATNANRVPALSVTHTSAALVEVKVPANMKLASGTEYRIRIRINPTYNRGSGTAASYTYNINGLKLHATDLNPLANTINLVVKDAAAAD